MYDQKDSQSVTLNRRHFMKFSSSLITSLSLAPNVLAKSQENKSPTKPNLLLVIAGQMNPLLTGLYGHPVVKTPHLNALAARRVRFDTAYSPCPVCAPAIDERDAKN